MSPIMSDQNDKHSPEAPYEDMPVGNPDLPEGWLEVVSMDMEAKGMARKPDGKVVFIDGALPTELVTRQRAPQKEQLGSRPALTHIHRESSQRVRPAARTLACTPAPAAAARCSTWTSAPRWPSSSACWRTTSGTWARSSPKPCCAPSKAPPGATATARRLSVRHVIKKGEVLVGFHERKSRYIADMETCKVLPPHVRRHADAAARADCQHGCARHLPAD